MMHSTAAKASMNETEYAVSCWKFWYFCWTSTVAVCVSPPTLPETTLTAPNSPRERARLRTTP